MRDKYLVITFALVVGIVFVTLYCLNKTSESNINLQYIDECIDGRNCIELFNEFYVGNNEKELQNGYYDYKVLNTQNGITIVINKLWYKEFNEMLYEQEYVKSLCRYISKICLKKANMALGESELDNLYNNILEVYTKAKKNIQYKNERVIDNIKFTFYTENYELILNMEVV